MVIAPTAAWATVTTYANAAPSTIDHVFTSSTGTIGANQGYVSGNTVTEYLNIRRASTGDLVGGTSGPGGTNVTLLVGVASGLYADCWWNYNPAVGGTLNETCKKSTQEGFAANSMSPRAIARTLVSPADAGTALSTITSIPTDIRLRLSEQGVETAGAVEVGKFASTTAWASQQKDGSECLLEVLAGPRGVAASACASSQYFATRGLALQTGTSSAAPEKVFLFPSFLNAETLTTLAQPVTASAAGLKVLIQPGEDNLPPKITNAYGTAISVPRFVDWSGEMAAGTR